MKALIAVTCIVLIFYVGYSLFRDYAEDLSSERANAWGRV